MDGTDSLLPCNEVTTTGPKKKGYTNYSSYGRYYSNYYSILKISQLTPKTGPS